MIIFNKNAKINLSVTGDELWFPAFKSNLLHAIPTAQPPVHSVMYVML